MWFSEFLSLVTKVKKFGEPLNNLQNKQKRKKKLDYLYIQITTYEP